MLGGKYLNINICMGMYLYGVQDINNLTFYLLFRDYPIVTVVLGTNDLNRVDEKSMRYNVTKCKHHGFSEIKYGNDIMLLKVRITF